MKLIKCEKCGVQIPTMMSINCRVIYYDKIDIDKGIVEVICTLGVYCPTCGTESRVSIKHYFYEKFADMPQQYLRDIALCEQGVI